MKLFFDFFPIILFFITYKFYGTYIATSVMMIATLLQIGVFWFKYHRIELMHVIALLVVLILGAATLFFHNDIFIKWKPTVVYWAMALVFLGTEIIGTTPLVQRLLGKKITLPKNIWRRLNLSWVLFFIVVGGVNLYIAYKFNTDVWVNFKLFGLLGSTIIFGILQSIYLARYLKESQ